MTKKRIFITLGLWIALNVCVIALSHQFCSPEIHRGIRAVINISAVVAGVWAGYQLVKKDQA